MYIGFRLYLSCSGTDIAGIMTAILLSMIPTAKSDNASNDPVLKGHDQSEKETATAPWETAQCEGPNNSFVCREG